MAVFHKVTGAPWLRTSTSSPVVIMGTLVSPESEGHFLPSPAYVLFTASYAFDEGRGWWGCVAFWSSYCINSHFDYEPYHEKRWTWRTSAKFSPELFFPFSFLCRAAWGEQCPFNYYFTYHWNFSTEFLIDTGIFCTDGSHNFLNVLSSYLLNKASHLYKQSHWSQKNHLSEQGLWHWALNVSPYLSRLKMIYFLPVIIYKITSMIPR